MTKSEKERSRRIYSAAIRAGKLVRPDRCPECGETGKIHGHHEDYAKPLDVVWLCEPCHSQVHAFVRWVDLEEPLICFDTFSPAGKRVYQRAWLAGISMRELAITLRGQSASGYALMKALASDFYGKSAIRLSKLIGCCATELDPFFDGGDRYSEWLRGGRKSARDVLLVNEVAR